MLRSFPVAEDTLHPGTNCPALNTCAGQCVARFTLVQPGMDTAAQFHTLQPVQDEQRAFDAFQLAQSHDQTVSSAQA